MLQREKLLEKEMLVLFIRAKEVIHRARSAGCDVEPQNQLRMESLSAGGRGSSQVGEGGA